MKMNLLFLLFLLIPPAAFPQFKPDQDGSVSCSMRKSHLTRLPDLAETTSNTPRHSFDVLNYTLSLNLYHCYASPYPTDFAATNTITFRIDSVLNSIALNAVNSSLTIDSVRMNGVSFTHAGNVLTIILNRAYSPGETAAVKIFYHHKNVTDYAFYASGGFVFTDCEPEGARCWFPCWDKPSDKATFDLTVKVPPNVKLGSNGYLADSAVSGDTLTYHWVSLQNVATYLMVITSKVNYNLDIVYWHKLSNPADSIPMRFYYNNGESPTGVENIIRPMTTWYSQSFCEHPYPKNGFAALNNQFAWGGMENQTLTSICPGCWSIGICSHEFAHQWFGDMITCATWADIWLNEGFATWCEARYQEKDGGYSTYKAYIDNDASSYFSNNPGWAISDPSWAVTTPSVNTLFNYAITYAKGACVLHQLRYLLGDFLFFATMQAYSADTNLRFQAARIADFNAKVNSVTGQNYDWFFNEWIYYPNHPVYQNSWFFENPSAGAWKVKFLASEVQTNAGFFKMPYILKIRFADNTDTVIRIMNDVNYQDYSWSVGKQPSSFYFDPDNQVVLKKGTTVKGKLWTGAVSDDWNASGNWDPAGVPVSTDNVRIAGYVAKMPTVKNTGLSCASLFIENGANLTINPGIKLTVNGKTCLEGSAKVIE
jgi:aminopeptidase N